MYAFYVGLAQGASATALARRGSLSRDVWRRVSRDGRSADGSAGDAATRFLLGRVTIPAAVAR